MDVGVDGGTAGDAAGGHVGVILRVDVLKALPWHTWAELYGSKSFESKKITIFTISQLPHSLRNSQKPVCHSFLQKYC